MRIGGFVSTLVHVYVHKTLQYMYVQKARKLDWLHEKSWWSCLAENTKCLLDNKNLKHNFTENLLETPKAA